MTTKAGFMNSDGWMEKLPMEIQRREPLTSTPKNSASLWTTYRVLPKLTVGGGAFYVDKVWGSELSNKWIPSYVRVDATATYEFGSAYSLQLNVQNLTDERYFDKAYPTHYASVAPGRSAIATLNVRF